MCYKVKKKVKLIVQTPLGRRALTLRGVIEPRSVALGSGLQGSCKQGKKIEKKRQREGGSIIFRDNIYFFFSFDLTSKKSWGRYSFRVL